MYSFIDGSILDGNSGNGSEIYGGSNVDGPNENFKMPTAGMPFVLKYTLIWFYAAFEA